MGFLVKLLGQLANSGPPCEFQVAGSYHQSPLPTTLDLAVEREASVQRWLRGKAEEQEEVEEEVEQICPICYNTVDDSKSCCFACCMQKSFHIDYVQHANLPSLVACPDCGTAPDTMPADPDVMAEGITAIATEFQGIAAELVRHFILKTSRL